METKDSEHATVSSRSSPPAFTPAAALASTSEASAICNPLGSLVSLFTRSGSRVIDRWVRSESLGGRGVGFKRAEWRCVMRRSDAGSTRLDGDHGHAGVLHGFTAFKKEASMSLNAAFFPVENWLLASKSQVHEATMDTIQWHASTMQTLEPQTK